MRFALEILEPKDTVAQRARDDILNAELGLQRRLRMRRVGMAQAPAMRQHLDAADVLRLDLVLAPQLERHVDRGMRAAATRELLERDRLRLDFPRRAPVLEQLFDVEGAGAVEDVEKALLVL